MHRSHTVENDVSRPRPLRDIAVVGAPIVALGIAGTLIGLETIAGGALVNLGYTVAIVAGAFVLRRQGSSWRSLGLARPASWSKTATYGIAAGAGAVVLFVAVQGLVAGIALSLGLVDAGIDQRRFNPIEGNLALFALLLVLAWTTIAFGEELFYRAFVVSRLVDHTAVGSWGAIVIAGAAFGVVHIAEGPVGILSNGAFGILFGWVYLRSGRNLWITVVGHGLINTLRFALLYVGAV